MFEREIEEETYLGSQSRRLLRRPKQLPRLLPLGLLDLAVVQEPHRRTPPYDPVPVVLPLRDRVVRQHQVRQPLEAGQRVQVRQLRQVVSREHQLLQVRDSVGQRRLYARHAVTRQQQRRDSRRQREVAQHLDVVVCEVDGVVGLFSSRVSKTDSPSCRDAASVDRKHTRPLGRKEEKRKNSRQQHPNSRSPGFDVLHKPSSGPRYQFCSSIAHLS